ncbi:MULTISPECIES: hypothetical protein [Mycobacteroides]|uniref:hypothetical protein n=1 Tax=Mycobacteroides TaxID=670516 RepID=UPI00092A668A|nr:MULTISPECIES: hypothetical protein [Mycobacteroides]MBV6360518.1 hypothetical protein [Mycobacteroides chelonae]SHW95313.1 Uncharacterised protein [Mycobacteroides abscessus subsp. abscessus]SKL77524.1 Uncharacterised protein [Mycobacteroides abscessus subsp. abscessus]SKM55207.1 Uncharacterised protein [Mycobacteroides abscessus subsp. abscessus]SLK36090.1 Uncharacterised protein [Mycobacteroides abscessus subsp. abscessus]
MSKSKVTNTVNHNGQTYTRTGRRYSHLVVVRSTHDQRPSTYWASTLELAERNASQIAGRRDRARQGTLRGMWGVEWHAGITDIDVVPVEHEEGD